VNLAVLKDGSIEVGGDHGTYPQSEIIDSFNGPGSGYRIFVGGGYFMDVARFNSDGTVDSAFGTGGIAEVAFADDEYASDITTADMAVSSDGSIVLAGAVGTLPTLFAPQVTVAVVRLHADGSPDTSFGSNGVVTTASGSGAGATSVSLQSEGKIVVTSHDNDSLVIIRYNSDGSLDSSFGSGGILTADII
jgi:uncharacterized delta-60 repeat protein